MLSEHEIQEARGCSSLTAGLTRDAYFRLYSGQTYVTGRSLQMYSLYQENHIITLLQLQILHGVGVGIVLLELRLFVLRTLLGTIYTYILSTAIGPENQCFLPTYLVYS